MKPKKSIYLDYAAGTPVDPDVQKLIRSLQPEAFANPSGLHTPAQFARGVIEHARADIAKILGAKTGEIYFTSGATEGINLAIQGVANAYPGTKLVATAIEHTAVLNCIEALVARGSDSELISVAPSGHVKAENVAKAINDNTVLVSVMYANHELGTIQPISQIANLIATIRADRKERGIELPLYLYCDASQGAGLLDPSVDRLKVDLLSFGGSKIYGPAGTGVLYVRAGTKVAPVIFGGGQERGLRSGSANTPGVAGLAKALDIAQSGRKTEITRLGKLADEFIAETLPHIANISQNGKSPRLPGHLNFTIPGCYGEDLVMYLDNVGIAVATGAACTASSDAPSHVLTAIGLDQESANSTLRLSMGRQTTQSDLAYVAQALPRIVDKIKAINT